MPIKNDQLKFIYSEKATKFCKISTLLLSYVVPVKSKVEVSQNFVAFSEYINIAQQLLKWNTFLFIPRLFDILQISYTGTYICEAIDHMDMSGSTISVYLRVTESKISIM